MAVPTITLNDGIAMPQVGYGVWKVPNDEATPAVETALSLGYRSVDTARLYYNEEGVGEAIAASDVPRGELFVTTKLWNTDHRYDDALRAAAASLRRLRLDYLDLFLIHWPAPARDRYVDAWRALAKLQADGKVRAIGVCNFQRAHLTRLIDETGVVPAVNQIELHPYLPQPELREFDRRHGITTEAWSPLGQGHTLLREPVLAELAAAHGRTPAQVVLRWHVQLGNVVIPKSVTPSRMLENLDVFGFELDPADMAAIDGLANGRRLGPDPDTFNWMG